MDESWFFSLLFSIMIIAPLSLMVVPIVWTLLEDVSKVRIPFALGCAIPFLTMVFQASIFICIALNVSLPFANKEGFVLVWIGASAIQYFVFRVTLRQSSGQPIRPIHALVASVVNVTLCSILLKWIY